jgi:hypothetical protein
MCIFGFKNCINVHELLRLHITILLISELEIGAEYFRQWIPSRCQFVVCWQYSLLMHLHNLIFCMCDHNFMLNHNFPLKSLMLALHENLGSWIIVGVCCLLLRCTVSLACTSYTAFHLLNIVKVKGHPFCFSFQIYLESSISFVNVVCGFYSVL